MHIAGKEGQLHVLQDLHEASMIFSGDDQRCELFLARDKVHFSRIANVFLTDSGILFHYLERLERPPPFLCQGTCGHTKVAPSNHP